MVPTVKKNYSVFCSIFFDDFFSRTFIFSTLTKNFASAVNKEIKIFLYQTVCDKKKLSNFDEFFCKKISKIDEKILWKGL